MHREQSVKAVRCTVTGRVQGVWFRGTTQKKAAELGVTGWARNEVDGTVTVLACGDDAAVDALVEWLHRGPRLAKVDSIDIEPADESPPSSFEVR